MRQAFLDGMSRAAWMVSVVTTDGPAGRAGLTVSAVSTLSADSPKPSLLVCVKDSNASTEVLHRNGVFCVNLLCDDQKYISDVFAGRTAAEDKFATGTWTTLATGSPVLKDALAVFDCSLENAVRHGTHWVLIGGLEAVAMPRGDASPLVHARRSYGRFVPFETEPTTAQPTSAATAAKALGS